jgi:hypothetical protein
VVPEPKRFKNAFRNGAVFGTTPSAPLRLLRDISLVAATPPNLGGATLTKTSSLSAEGKTGDQKLRQLCITHARLRGFYRILGSVEFQRRLVIVPD